MCNIPDTKTSFKGYSKLYIMHLTCYASDGWVAQW